MAKHGHYGGRPGHTLQGIYVCSPSGRFLASINSNSPDRVLRMMRQGLKAWEQLPKSEKALPKSSKFQPRHRWEQSYPKDGLVLTMTARDLPEKCDPSLPCSISWNQDQVWFSKAEARLWLPKDPKPKDRHPVPQKLVHRLARLHLVDTVRGQTTPFSRQQVNGSHLTVVVTSRQKNKVKIRIAGETRADSTGRRRRERPHGVVTKILGYGTFDLSQSTFTEFQLVALGRRWGSTQFNGRWRGPQSGPIGFVFELPQMKGKPVAPAFIYAYEAPWVIRPR